LILIISRTWLSLPWYKQVTWQPWSMTSLTLPFVHPDLFSLPPLLPLSPILIESVIPPLSLSFCSPNGIF
jgi:hypothetical protein